jgi:hypothetical protein
VADIYSLLAFHLAIFHVPRPFAPRNRKLVGGAGKSQRLPKAHTAAFGREIELSIVAVHHSLVVLSFCEADYLLKFEIWTFSNVRYHTSISGQEGHDVFEINLIWSCYSVFDLSNLLFVLLESSYICTENLDVEKFLLGLLPLRELDAVERQEFQMLITCH